VECSCSASWSVQTFARLFDVNSSSSSNTLPATDQWFIDVATELRTRDRHRLLTYSVPDHLREDVLERGLVWVPLRSGHKVAVVVRAHRERPGFEVRDVQAIVEPGFQFSDGQWEVITWLSEQTICTLYDAAVPFFPPAATTRGVEHLALKDPLPIDIENLTTAQRELVLLLERRGEISLDVARRALGRRLTSIVPSLEQQGVISRLVRVRAGAPKTRKSRMVTRTAEPAPELKNSPAQRRALEVVERRLRVSRGQPVAWDDLTRHVGVNDRALNELKRKELIQVEPVVMPQPTIDSNLPESRVLRLSEAQAASWRRLHASLRERKYIEYLLHGVTGSGKTELYLRAAAWCISRGLGVVILVPEIALASQISQRIAARFPGQAAILHSKLPESERYHIWDGVRHGRVPIVVGPRSVLFSPMPEIGLIVIDEEHDPAFKQGQIPRYHARDVARLIAQQHEAMLLLGSASPDVTTFRRTMTGEIERLSLPERIGEQIGVMTNGSGPPSLELPEVEIVDMREELRHGNAGLFSRALEDRIKQTLAQNEQAILFLNRRGAATFIQCRSCGYVAECPMCDVPLVYHPDRRRALCHRCNYQVQTPTRCPSCELMTISYYGSGTQRVEREANKRFPGARVLRWDRDVIRGNVTHETLMNRVIQREADIVVGTQLIAKGFDFPDVMTIGVINADGQLHLPDFRSSERTFQLLMQVAGRAGRRVGGSSVVFQSYSPHHYAIQTAARHDYEAFASEELAFRELHRYPPFSRLVRLLYRHLDPVECESAARELAEDLTREAERSGFDDVEILGPTPAFVARIRGYYQWQIVLRGEDAQPLTANAGIAPGWLIDVDPLSMI
jgi:primosomal protein N' (replication factor Y) (superfamily II helicase)